MERALFPTGSERRWSHRHLVLASLCLTLVAGVPRFANLGELSFLGDEETSAFPARSIVEQGQPVMPSGMEYRRALPQSWVNSISARWFGLDRELSYRIPAALLGTLTVPLLFVGARRLFGAPTALTAAVLLSLSAWHLSVSRMNRMYAPLIFFFLLATFAGWRWVETGRARPLMLATLAYATAVSLHAIGIVASFVPLLALSAPGWPRVRVPKLAFGSLAAAASGYLYHDLWVSEPYRRWERPGRTSAPDPSGLVNFESLLSIPWWHWTLALVGLSVGLFAAARSGSRDEEPGALLRRIASFSLAGVTGAAAFTGQLYGAGLATLLFLLLQQRDRRELLRRTRLPATVMLAAGACWLFLSVGRFGFEEGSKALVRTPFPYFLLLGQRLTGVLLLFAAASVWLALRPASQEDRGLRATVVLVVTTVAGLGVVADWAPDRYLMITYPFILLVAAHALIHGIRFAQARFRVLPGVLGATSATAIALVVASSGALGSHGIPQAIAVATQDHGKPRGLLAHALELRPDHRGAGRFLRGVYEEGDVVIAEDPLQIRWYSGRADYWLRGLGDARKFIHAAPDGTLRDIYVNSRLVIEVDTLRSIAGRSGGRAWLATSAETVRQRAYYLDVEQRAWLDSLEAATSPLFTGEDSLTRVYCLGCQSD